MVKRENAGSGLRAGFVRGDGLIPPASRKKEKPKAEETEPKAPPAVPEAPPEPEAITGPTMTMQGISGKKISAAIRVVKAGPKTKKPAVEPDKESTEPDKITPDAKEAASADTQAIQATVAPTRAEVPETKAAARTEPATRVTKTKKASAEPQVQVPAEQTAEPPAEPAAVQPAVPPVKTDEALGSADKPEQPQVAVAEPSKEPTGKKAPSDRKRDAGTESPAAGVPGAAAEGLPQTASAEATAAEKAPAAPGAAARPALQEPRPSSARPGRSVPFRPQGDRALIDRMVASQRQQSDRPAGGSRPSAPRAPVSSRPQGERPGGDRPQGGRPQGDRPGYGGARPQGGQRPQGDRQEDRKGERFGDRSGGGARSSGARGGGFRGGDLPIETKPGAAHPDRLIARREDKRESRKETTKMAPPADMRDKHRTLRQQTQVLSTETASAALSNERILDTLYQEPVKPTRGRGRGKRGAAQAPAPVVRAVLTHVRLPEQMTVKEFAEAIKKTAAEVIKKLMKLGVMATLNQEIDFDTATIIAEEFDITTEKIVEVSEEEILFDDAEDDPKKLVPRPPVVVVMGHVDHGKTSILDRIRSATVATGEAGGITQHIGAYTVRVKDRQITFLDTPGHEAFTTMRARGAQVTDVAILVVAADDGVMPQTREAINHARAANTQIVVALNKIDKPGINLDRVKQELATEELIPEEWGGATVMVPVSAKTGEGIDELLDMVLLTADILDLRADPDRQAKGTVIEAKLDRNRGPVATVLVQRGTLSVGDTLVTGTTIGHVRAMSDDKGQMVRKAGPSIPVEILGLPDVPEAGELFYAVTDEKVARVLAEKRRVQQREQQLRASSRMSLDTLFTKLSAGEVKDLNIVIKADVQGSVEALRQSLEKLTTDEIRVQVIHGAVGAVSESDIRLAEVSNAIVIGFNVRPAPAAAELAKSTGVDMRLYRIIYNAIEDIEAAMKGMLAPKMTEVILGHAQVRQVFRVSGVGAVAGCYVTDGHIPRSVEIRLVRDGIVVHEGKIASLRRFKDDVREVAAGYECGIGIERFNDIKENDVIEAFEMQEVERS